MSLVKFKTGRVRLKLVFEELKFSKKIDAQKELSNRGHNNRRHGYKHWSMMMLLYK